MSPTVAVIVILSIVIRIKDRAEYLREHLDAWIWLLSADRRVMRANPALAFH
jgi:hypothetical protein